MSNHYYVYHLIDPRTNLPFYVGKGKDNRAWSHLTETFCKSNPDKSYQIIEIRKDNYELIVTILQSNLGEQEAFDLEEFEIRKYGRRIDGGILTNLTFGQIGGDTSRFFTEETYRKLREANRGVKNSSSKLTEKQVIEVYHSTLSSR
jgi:hypothetical protein